VSTSTISTTATTAPWTNAAGGVTRGPIPQPVEGAAIELAAGVDVDRPAIRRAPGAVLDRLLAGGHAHATGCADPIAGCEPQRCWCQGESQEASAARGLVAIARAVNVCTHDRSSSAPALGDPAVRICPTAF
jgi:hypothetical protein